MCWFVSKASYGINLVSFLGSVLICSLLPRVVGAQSNTLTHSISVVDDTYVVPLVIEEPASDLDIEEVVEPVSYDGELKFDTWKDFLDYVCYICNHRDGSLETQKTLDDGTIVWVRTVDGLEDSGLTLGMAKMLFNQGSAIDCMESSVATDDLLGIVTYFREEADRGHDDATIVGLGFEFKHDADTLGEDVGYVEETCSDIISTARNIENLYDRVTYIEDRLCELIKYDDSLKVNDMAGALRTGVGVCSSYAKLMEYMCNESGVLCEYVTGDGRSTPTVDWEYHALNRVFIDGRWWYLDATWDDGLGDHTYLFHDLSWFEAHGHRLATMFT